MCLFFFFMNSTPLLLSVLCWRNVCQCVSRLPWHLVRLFPVSICAPASPRLCPCQGLLAPGLQVQFAHVSINSTSTLPHYHNSSSYSSLSSRSSFHLSLSFVTPITLRPIINFCSCLTDFWIKQDWKILVHSRLCLGGLAVLIFQI